MLWAFKNGEKVIAKPNLKDAHCQICNDELIPKCGKIKIWHFAHKSAKDCDSWAEPESEWHKGWKDLFPKEQQEIVIEEKWDNKHRADILNKDKIVIELQNSPISPEEIQIREIFYKNRSDGMIWLLNGNTLAKGLKLRNKKGILTFRWKHPPKSWWSAKQKVYIDLSNLYGDIEIFLVKKIYPNVPCGGWGIKLTKEEFKKEYGAT